jgi:hypothetical protein
VQFGRDAPPAVVGRLQRDALDGIAQVDVLVPSGGRGQKAVVTGPAQWGQSAHLCHAHARFPPDLLLDVFVDRGFPFNACNIRCSSMRCKQPFKKSISSVCWPIFRSLRIPSDADQRSEVMAITIPSSCRSRFRAHADHDSELMAITGPTGSRSLFGSPRNGDRHRRNRFLKPSS